MIRYSPIAGSWYPADPESLKETINELFLDKKFGPGYDPKEEKRNCNDHLVGIGVPHAGYFFSGAVAAHSYAHLFNHLPQIDSAIIFGPNHQFGYPSISIFPEGHWELPLGNAEIDTELVEFAEQYENSTFHEVVQFEAESQRYEHSIEIQIPFLQYLYGSKFKILPICFGNQDFNQTGKIISQFVYDLLMEFQDRRIAVLASSDLSHEPDIKLLENNDRTMLKLLEENRLEDAIQFRQQVGMTMCGYGPVFTLANLTRKFGTPKNKVLKYAHSSEIRPKHRGPYTVGYPSLAFEF
ncbi:MAG: AmmeMemoRadiSam system protein B [Methanobacteriota archaeon]|nr:MAG: AmmeMemoRadiSam system protein B [Euryarchaeota archaeon]